MTRLVDAGSDIHLHCLLVFAYRQEKSLRSPFDVQVVDRSTVPQKMKRDRGSDAVSN